VVFGIIGAWKRGKARSLFKDHNLRSHREITMKKAYTVTVVSETKEGKAVIMAGSHREAMEQAGKVCPAGFRVFKVQDNSEEQTGFLDGHHRRSAMRCSLGGVAESGKVHKPRSKPAFWTGKKTGDFKKC
jgi:hypothetical protein